MADANAIQLLCDRAQWYRDGCDGLENREGYLRDGLTADAANDLTRALDIAKAASAGIDREGLADRLTETARMCRSMAAAHSNLKYMNAWLTRATVCEEAAAALRSAPRDMVCEQHPELPWPHGDCAGPGCPLSAQTRLLVMQRRDAQQSARAYEAMASDAARRIQELEAIADREGLAAIEQAARLLRTWATDRMQRSGKWTMQEQAGVNCAIVLEAALLASAPRSDGGGR